MSRRDGRDSIDDEIVRPLREATLLREAAPALDEVHRARLEAAIEARIDRWEARRRSDRSGPGWRPSLRPSWRVALVALVACGAGAVGAAAVVLGVRGHQTSPPAALVARVQERPDDSPRALAPSDRLIVPRGARVRVTVGTTVRLTLIGPAVLNRGAPPPGGRGHLLSLERGRLLVDYDGSTGEPLQIRSPGVLTTVVGTLFSVEVIDGRTRVAVRRGRVDVVPDEAPDDAKGERQQLTPGEAWTEGSGIGVIPPDLAVALAEHDSGHPASPEPAAAVGRAWPATAARPRTVAHAAAPRPSPARPSAEPSRLDLDGAYAAAEGQLRAGDRANAREALQRLVARDPDGVHGEAARLDLARIALAAGDPAEARRQLRGMAEPTRDPALAETTHHLRCQAEVRLGAEGDATSCLQAFRRLYPDSPHDAEALALLAARAPCADAGPLLDEYLRLYPRGPFATTAVARRESCAAADR